MTLVDEAATKPT